MSHHRVLDGDERLGFVPQNIMPCQMEGGIIRPDEPERELLAAALLDAFEIYQRCRARGKTHLRKYVEAERWFAADRRDYLFAFARICDVLGIEPDAVRRCLDDPPRRALGFQVPAASIARLRAMLRAGMSQYRAAALVGVSDSTAEYHRRQLVEEIGEIFCPCGKPSNHREACPDRVALRREVAA